MDKPLLKNAVEYFRDPSNWYTIWANGMTGLHIQKLRHVKCLRLVLEDHQVNEYVHYVMDPLLYFPEAEIILDMHNTYDRESLPDSEIRFLIKERWTEHE